MTRDKLIVAITAAKEGFEAIEHVLKNAPSGDVVDAEVNALLDALQDSLTDARLGDAT